MIAFGIYLIAAIAIGSVAGRKLKKTFAPDQFKGKWYEYTTNQISHIGIGVAMVVMLMIFHQQITGEFFNRLYAFIVILVGYTCFECCQNGKSRDIIEDIVFVVGLGVGSALVFKWKYDTYVCGHVNYLLIFFAD
jgi:hypothetical protein